MYGGDARHGGARGYEGANAFRKSGRVFEKALHVIEKLAHVTVSLRPRCPEVSGAMPSTCAYSAVTRMLRVRLKTLNSCSKPSLPTHLGGLSVRSASTTTTSTADDNLRESCDQPDDEDRNHASTSSSTTGPSSTALYPGHVKLTTAQKALLALTSGVGAIAFPERADLVGTVNEISGVWSLRNMRDRMRADPVGAELLKRRPRITDETLESAHECKDGTLGKEWAEFMGVRKFDPNDRPPVRFVDSEELAYVATRAREVHDIWHVLFQCPTTVQGELALKAVEFFQTGAPAPAMAALLAPARLPPKEREYLINTMYPWARRAGRRAADLVCLDYENEMDTNLEDLRMKWRIDVAPKRD